MRWMIEEVDWIAREIRSIPDHNLKKSDVDCSPLFVFVQINNNPGQKKSVFFGTSASLHLALLLPHY